jgi:hypothetical protein
MLIIFLTSYLTYFAYFLFSSVMDFSKSQATIFALFSFPQFYLTIFLVSTMCLLYDLGISFISINFKDLPTNLLRKYINVYIINKGK